MKKLISAVIILAVIGGFVFLGIYLFSTGNVDSIEIVGNMQTVYFVGSTTNANFEDAELKVTYKNGSVQMKKLSKNIVAVNNFSTSVVNDGKMKILYKTKSVDVPYSVMWTGLYYLDSQTQYSYNGSSVSKSTQGPYVAGLNSSNQDKTTAKEMIYFYKDGACDYYSRTSSTGTWYLDDGHADSSFYYEVEGDTIIAHLGKSKTYTLQSQMSNDGAMSLIATENNYVSGTSFLKNKIERHFEHYEMKGTRTFGSSNISVYYPSGSLKLKKGSTYESNGQKIYVVVNFVNDNFLKTVYVRFNSSMISDKRGFDTSYVQTASYERCFYKGVQFNVNYSVYA